jgi:hypothetical protein
VKFTSADVPFEFIMADTAVGGGMSPAGVTALEIADNALVPMAVVAVTTAISDCPLLKPVNAQLVAVGEVGEH